MHSCRRRVLFDKGSPTPPTPIPYQQVEYLESDGTQYIDTEIYPNTATFKFEIEYADIANHNIRCGCRSSRKGFWFCNGGNTGRIYDKWAIEYGSQVSYTTCQNDGQFHIVKMDNVVNFDGSPIITFNSQSVQCDYTFTLFCANQGTTKYYGYMKIKKFKAYIDNIIVIDAVPIIDNGVGEMYNKVTRLFLPRYGTLIVGPDIN